MNNNIMQNKISKSPNLLYFKPNTNTIDTLSNLYNKQNFINKQSLASGYHNSNLNSNSNSSLPKIISPNSNYRDNDNNTKDPQLSNYLNSVNKSQRLDNNSRLYENMVNPLSNSYNNSNSNNLFNDNFNISNKQIMTGNNNYHFSKIKNGQMNKFNVNNSQKIKINPQNLSTNVSNILNPNQQSFNSENRKNDEYQALLNEYDKLTNNKDVLLRPLSRQYRNQIAGKSDNNISALYQPNYNTNNQNYETPHTDLQEIIIENGNGNNLENSNIISNNKNGLNTGRKVIDEMYNEYKQKKIKSKLNSNQMASHKPKQFVIINENKNKNDSNYYNIDSINKFDLETMKNKNLNIKSEEDVIKGIIDYNQNNESNILNQSNSNIYSNMSMFSSDNNTSILNSSRLAPINQDKENELDGFKDLTIKKSTQNNIGNNVMKIKRIKEENQKLLNQNIAIQYQFNKDTNNNDIKIHLEFYSNWVDFEFVRT